MRDPLSSEKKTANVRAFRLFSGRSVLEISGERAAGNSSTLAQQLDLHCKIQCGTVRIMQTLLNFTNKWEIQVRKGIIEFMILLSLRERDQYGFELIDGLTKKAQISISDGTIYPLMLRLVNDGLVQAYWSLPQGDIPPRKYYTLTPQGIDAMEFMRVRWRSLVFSMDALLLLGPR